MVVRAIVIVALTHLGGCASFEAQLPPQEVALARSKVERYLLENGFTCLAPTNKNAFVPRRLTEDLLDAEDIGHTRRCDYKRHAYSYQLHSNGAISFIFKQDRPPHYAHVAGIESDGEIFVSESYCDLRQKGFRLLPSNKSLDWTRGR